MLVIRTVAVNPLFHSLLTRYWHLPPVPTLATELDELAGIEELAGVEERTELEEDDSGLLLATLLVAVLLPPPPTMPKGAGWPLQVLAEIQLLLFS